MHRLAAVPLLLVTFILAHAGPPVEYDPLRVDDFKPERVDQTVKDEKRAREIPIRVYLPKETAAAPVVLFSHGLGGSRMNNPYLGEHWARRGYVVVFIQHAGSDEGVWKNTPLAERMPAMRKAASGENFLLRTQDVPAVLNQLDLWNQADGHALKGRLDLTRLGMSGHSFGAVTTQAVSGQSFPAGRNFTEPRIKAAVMMSPSVPAVGDPARAFGSVKIPWLLMTGTDDNSPIGNADAKSRLKVFPALPAGSNYEVVLEGAEHSAFGDRELPGERGKHNPNHHRVILALSTAFWDAYLKDDAAAKSWLDGEAPKGVMEKADQWRKK